LPHTPLSTAEITARECNPPDYQFYQKLIAYVDY
jgi:hypothetical protein